jgi:hypothetical protein
VLGATTVHVDDAGEHDPVPGPPQANVAPGATLVHVRWSVTLPPIVTLLGVAVSVQFGAPTNTVADACGALPPPAKSSTRVNVVVCDTVLVNEMQPESVHGPAGTPAAGGLDVHP